MFTQENVVALDLETSGLDPIKHGIVEIGCVNTVTGREFSQKCRIEPHQLFDPEVTAVNGVTEAQARDPRLPTQKQALENLLKFTSGSKLTWTGFNVGKFDVRFLNYAYHGNLVNDFPGASRRSIDLSAAGHFILSTPETPSMNATLEQLGLPAEALPHAAVEGARLASICYDALRGKLQQYFRVEHKTLVVSDTETELYTTTKAVNGIWSATRDDQTLNLSLIDPLPAAGKTRWEIIENFKCPLDFICVSDKTPQMFSDRWKAACRKSDDTPIARNLTLLPGCACMFIGAYFTLELELNTRGNVVGLRATR